MGRKILIFGLVIMIFAFGAEVRSLWIEKQAVNKDFEAMKAKLQETEKERGRLQADLEYLSLPENLRKELKARFHYQSPDEKVLILIPGKNEATGTATTTGN